MNHAEPASTPPLQLWLTRLVFGLAAVLGLVYGYDFGKLIGGPVVGVVLALNCAVFCSILAGAVAEKLCRWRPASRLPNRPSAT